jgi:hypothetical protein
MVGGAAPVFCEMTCGQPRRMRLTRSPPQGEATVMAPRD